MILFIKKTYFNLQVRLLVKFKPTLLFDKINQLDWYKEMLQQWVDDQKLSRTDLVLEAGCASGALTAYISESGSLVTGVDASSKMIDSAKLKHEGINFQVADVLNLGFKNNSFDVVFAASLLNIIPDKKNMVSELARVCKQGGKVCVLIPSSDFKNSQLKTLKQNLQISGFSAAALEAWHKLPPKMGTANIISLFSGAGLTDATEKHHLEGMIVSITGTKPL